jgi:hypothetical protein
VTTWRLKASRFISWNTGSVSHTMFFVLAWNRMKLFLHATTWT